jgi:hypothetical protein
MPTANANGVVTITLIVTDGSSSAQDTFFLTVNAVNDAPTISDVTNKSTLEDTALNNVAVTINDIDSTVTCASSLTATSSNQTRLPNGNITIGGTAPNCTVSMQPAVNQNGTTTVTLNVSDGALSGVDTFVLTITAVNDAPTISNITDKSTNEDTALNNVAFTIGDVDSTISCTSTTGVTFASTNTSLLPAANITRG